ncbi:MAG: protein kinase, partial [Cyanobacteria bacterium]|nr:protein kinase [Cyanobacteriota bacterium]
ETYQCIQNGDNAYITMQYVDGESLAHQLHRQGRLEQSEALDMFLEICQAIEFAHLKGVVHRDLKPSNILIESGDDNDRLIKVSDFGAALLLPSLEEDVTRLTRTGEIFGSPLYMSPEQCIGDQVDERSDVYSMGCLMYEVLSGRAPFAGSNPIKVIFQQVNTDPAAINDLNLGISNEISLVVNKCLQKEAGKRYRSFAELRADLELVKAGKRPTSRSSLHAHRSAPGAHWAKRLTATFIDGLILTACLYAVSLVMYVQLTDLWLAFLDLSFCFFSIHSFFGMMIPVGSLSQATLLTYVFSSLVNWTYRAVFESSPYGATPGKMLMGLKVIDVSQGTQLSFWQAFFRQVAKSLVVMLPVAILVDVMKSLLEDYSVRQAFKKFFSVTWWNKISGSKVVDIRAKDRK